MTLARPEPSVRFVPSRAMYAQFPSDLHRKADDVRAVELVAAHRRLSHVKFCLPRLDGTRFAKFEFELLEGWVGTCVAVEHVTRTPV
eukprot:CAMPEP_0205955786 /NCGR_PEP_ID=MMETSP1459-20131121/33406_1 /ASSEMBLY_ACC=CAM_ASM_001120 /TAXON_ID=41880 /ORGANISM="Pycnococcus provasolii, Strain RCC931" /LENGTH=86 /DNA_ID=CAMNT_0053328143 /DNA_START=33 /DNA_END=289 /DNA_ORIENTATION=-